MKMKWNLKTIFRWFRNLPLWQKGVLFVVLFLVLTYAQPESQAVISGYDGLVATISSVQYDHLDSSDHYQTPTTAGVDPFFNVLNNPCGIRMELQGGVNVLKNQTENKGELVRWTNRSESKTREVWKLQIVKTFMGVTLRTYGDGVGTITDVTFWIQLKENDFSVFSDADESYAFILNVYTRTVPEITGSMEVVPMSKGYDFPLTPVSKGTLPDWMSTLLQSDVGMNVKNLQPLQIVEFPIKVESATPQSFFGLAPSPSQAVYDIGIDVYLIGYWEETKPVREWDTPTPPNWFDGLVKGVTDFFGGFLGVFADTLSQIGLQTLVPVILILVLVIILFNSGKTIIRRLI